MPARRTVNLQPRGCPARCHAAASQQRKVTDNEFRSISKLACEAVHTAGSQCYICMHCGRVYICETYLDIRLGRLLEGSDGTHWQSEDYP